MTRFPIPEARPANTPVLTELQQHFDTLYDAIGAKLVVSREISTAITKLDEAWLWLCKAMQ